MQHEFRVEVRLLSSLTEDEADSLHTRIEERFAAVINTSLVVYDRERGTTDVILWIDAPTQAAADAQGFDIIAGSFRPTKEARMDKLVSAGEVATVLGVHVNYVYDKAKHGGMPSYKIGGVRRFDLGEVHTWLRESCRS